VNLTEDGITPELFALIQAHAATIAAAAPMPTPEDIAQLRRWFTPDALRLATDQQAPVRRSVA
jgi:hypothetical protein